MGLVTEEVRAALASIRWGTYDERQKAADVLLRFVDGIEAAEMRQRGELPRRRQVTWTVSSDVREGTMTVGPEDADWLEDLVGESFGDTTKRTLLMLRGSGSPLATVDVYGATTVDGDRVGAGFLPPDAEADFYVVKGVSFSRATYDDGGLDRGIRVSGTFAIERVVEMHEPNRKRYSTVVQAVIADGVPTDVDKEFRCAACAGRGFVTAQSAAGYDGICVECQGHGMVRHPTAAPPSPPAAEPTQKTPTLKAALEAALAALAPEVRAELESDSAALRKFAASVLDAPAREPETKLCEVEADEDEGLSIAPLWKDASRGELIEALDREKAMRRELHRVRDLAEKTLVGEANVYDERARDLASRVLEGEAAEDDDGRSPAEWLKEGVPCQTCEAPADVHDAKSGFYYCADHMPRRALAAATHASFQEIQRQFLAWYARHAIRSIGIEATETRLRIELDVEPTS